MIPLYKVFMPEGLGGKLETILLSGSISYGRNARSFELKLSTFLGNSLVCTTSGNPVFLALKSFGIGPGDEVIASPMMCLASSQPVVMAGARIVWADVDPLTGSLDPADVKRKISPSTKAIIHFHWGGQLGHIDEIMALAQSKGIIVIEDATEAFGARINGKMLGSHGADATCFAFTPVRVPAATEGGAVAFRDNEAFEKCSLIRDYGIDRSRFRDSENEINPDCDIPAGGDGMLPTEITGLIGDEQMEHAGSLIGRHRSNAEYLDTLFGNLTDPAPLKISEKAGSVYWVYTILSDNRDEWLRRFRRSGFYASRMHFRNDMYSVFGKSTAPLKGVDEFSSRELNIPCGWWMTPDDHPAIAGILQTHA